MNYQKIFSQILASVFVLSIFFSFVGASHVQAYQYSNLEKPGDVAVGSIIPCTNKCELTDVFRLINNLIEFAMKVLLMPLFVIMIMYAGFTYITAMGNESKVVKMKSMFMHMIGGLVLVLCSWLIVKGILYALGYSDSLLFFS